MKLLATLALVGALLISAPIKAQQATPAPYQSYYLVGPITLDQVPYVLAWIKGMPNPQIFIDSPGGSMAASEQIADAIKAKGNVRCVVVNKAASGAFAIHQACQQRLMTSRSLLITHEPRSMFPGYVDRVGALLFLEAIEDASRQWAARCRARLKVPPAEYDAKVKGRDWVIDATEAIKIGAVDIVLP